MRLFIGFKRCSIRKLLSSVTRVIIVNALQRKAEYFLEVGNVLDPSHKYTSNCFAWVLFPDNKLSGNV